MPIATVTQLESKSHDTPDETRPPPKTDAEQVSVGGYTRGRFTFEPGWRWSECIKPVAGTESCQLSHVGYVISGRLHVAPTDRQHLELKAGEADTPPPRRPDGLERRRPAVGSDGDRQRRRLRQTLKAGLVP